MVLKLRSIKTRVLLLAGAGFIGACTILTFAGAQIMMSKGRDEAIVTANSLLNQYKDYVHGEIDRAVAAATVTKSTAEAIAYDYKVERGELAEILALTVESQPNLIGMALAFEPDALDRRDKEYLADTYSDATGRFAPYFFWTKEGKVSVEPLNMKGAEGWYDKPLRENRNQITPAYLYPVNGEEVLMSTVSIVIRRDKAPIGIITADIGLKKISDEIGSLKPFGEGSVSLV
ncbi:cache domain-containing protein, partial [Microvirga sp. ACRRW]|uniref:cache domain-containing protein n=1 Tax=Microvirga sp. ACRRW TaxID=2918205 RepID=UPI001EF4EDDB